MFSALARYRRNAWEWDAKGGCYVSRWTDCGASAPFPTIACSMTSGQWYDVVLGLVSQVVRRSCECLTRSSTSFHHVRQRQGHPHHFRDLVFGRTSTRPPFSPSSSLSATTSPRPGPPAPLSVPADCDKGSRVDAITDQATGAQYFYGGNTASTEHESGFLLAWAYQYTF